MKVILEAQHACTQNPRGIGRYSILLIRSLARRANNRYVLTFFDYGGQAGNRSSMERYFGDLRVPFYECNTISYYDAFTKPVTETYEDFTGATGDVFHFMHFIKFPGLIEGTPVITLHDTMPLTHPEWFEPRIAEYARIFAGRIRQKRPLLLANSECTKRDAIEYIGVDEEDVVVIPHAYDSETCYPDRNFSALRELGVNSPYLLYMGPIDERKNIRLLLVAFERLSTRFDGVKLVVAGVPDKASGSEVFHILKNLATRSRVLLITHVSDAERRVLYSNALAFIFPSLYEGFGVPVLEAFACGCPVITSNVSALPEVAGNAAVLIDPQDEDALAYQMERLLDDDGFRAGMVARGIERAKTFSYDKTAKLTEDAYRLAVERK